MNITNPTPAEIRAARLAARLTQTQAAALIGYSMQAWQTWEAGTRRMRRGVLESFLAKAAVDKS